MTDVSVALCTYNGRPYLSEQIESILSQSRSPDEIIICDDGSTDGTTDILERYQSEYSDVIDYRQNDRTLGPAKNFEKALELTTGDVVVLSDQDDVWLEEKIAIQLESIVPNGIVFHDGHVVDQHLEGVDRIASDWALSSYDCGQYGSRNEMLAGLLRRNFIKGATLMIGDEMLNRCLPIPEAWFHDAYIGIVASLTGSVTPIDLKLYKYRLHERQTSKRRPNSMLGDIKRGISDLVRNDFDSDVEKWSRLLDVFENFQASGALSVDLEVSQAETDIQRRLQYERNLSEIASGVSGDAVRSIAENLSEGYYSQFGVSRTSLHVLRDTLWSLREEFGK